MGQYVTSSKMFGIQQQLFQVLEQITSGIMLYNPSPNFTDEEMGSDSTYSDTDIIEDIIKYFRNTNTRMDNLSITRAYLCQHLDIAELARFVSEQVYCIFDSNTQLCLEVHSDEDDPDKAYLALFLRVSSYDDSVMARIEQIQKSYYEALSKMTGWFLFTTDFSPPR